MVCCEDFGKVGAEIRPLEPKKFFHFLHFLASLATIFTRSRCFARFKVPYRSYLTGLVTDPR